MIDAPPSEVRDWDLSFAATLARQTGVNKFRWRDGNGGEWMCDRIAGDCDMDSIKQMGHVTVHCSLLLQQSNGKTVAFVQTDPDLIVAQVPDGTLLPSSHYRLCANLRGAEDDKWRLLDERKGTAPDALRHVRGYKGRTSLSWLDSGPHVHHDGPVLVDTDNVAHLLTEEQATEVEARQ